MKEISDKKIQSIIQDGYQMAADRHYDGTEKDEILGCCPDAALCYEDDGIDPEMAQDWVAEGVYQYFEEKEAKKL